MYVGTSRKKTARRLTRLDREQPSTPPSSQSSPDHNPAFFSRPDEDDDGADRRPSSLAPKKGGYDGRIQQILYENPDLEIIITDAGKSADGGYIVYRIRTGVRTPTSQHVRHTDCSRILRYLVDIQSLRLYVQHLSACILHL